MALFEEFVAPFARAGTTVHVGGAVGIDTAALDWLARCTDAAIVVVVPCTVADQPDVAAAAVRRWQDAHRLAAVVELGAARLGRTPITPGTGGWWTAAGSSSASRWATSRPVGPGTRSTTPQLSASRGWSYRCERRSGAPASGRSCRPDASAHGQAAQRSL
ncbi:MULTISPECIES: hypothetical protein [unclassified Pseudonocardia]|uniref:hypothetical protein n=1 Tax=unclassified Pseudonocardia TaxID=2619320 RepID=UPI001D04792D|nr:MULTISPECIES: hypothetical protein [unclassified Pseudonocardia]